MNASLSVIDNKKQQMLKLLILCVFASVMYIIRIPFGFLSDDALWAPTIGTQTLWGNFIERWTYNGRIFTDVLANAFYRVPMTVWKIFDTIVYVHIALLLSKLFTKDSWFDLSVTCILVFLFPMRYLMSAGYIASTTNYVYPVACLLNVVYYLSLIRQGKRTSIIRHLFTVICVLYIANHDQSGMVLVGGLFLYLVYSIITKEDKRIVGNTVFWLVLSVASYAFMFLIPGHIYRMNDVSEMMRWLPQYANWSLAQKIYHGYTTTVANFLFSDVKLFILLSLLIFILSLSQSVLHKKVIAAIPLVLMIVTNLIGEDHFIVVYSYACGMPDLLPLSQSVIPLLVTISSVCSIFYTIYSCVENKQLKWLILMLLFLAAGSREMMGLSATIYASSFRTFTFFLYSNIACCLLILQELKRNENIGFWYSGIGAILAMLIF